jgi:ATP-dependent phosphofructokinase / diphosphate-dependent phosphofructokinase
VKLAERGEGGVMVTLERANKRGQRYKSAFGTIPLKKVAINARPMDDKYIGKDGMSVTKAFHDYAAPLVGELPTYASLTIRKARS